MTKKNIITILILLILGLGLIATVYLVQKQVIFKPKAALNLPSVFSITKPSSETLQCQNTPAGAVCTTDENTVSVRFNEANLQELLNNLP